MTMGVAVDAALRALPPRLARREAERLLAHTLGQSRAWVVAHPEAELTPEQHTRFGRLAAQAAEGTPLPYLLGRWEFFGLDFVVTPEVLIPRPETELLVERALALAEARARSGAQPLKILDVGTGSGIVAVTLAKKLPHARVTAADLSPAALAVAQRNADAHAVALTLIESNLLVGLMPRAAQAAFDLLCANLPYIPTADLALLAVARHEPRLALDGGPDGLALVRRLLADAPQVLAPGGAVLLEIEYRQGAAAAALARAAFPGATVALHKDLAGLDRVIEVRTPGGPA